MNREDAERAIRDAWIVGIIAVGATILLTLIYATGTGLSHVDRFNLVDIVILVALTYGIYRRNLLAAAVMPVYYLGVKMVFWLGERAFIGVPISLVFAYFFYRGARAIYDLRREREIESGGELPSA